MLEAKGKFWGEKFGRTWNPRRDGTRSVRPIVNCGILKTEKSMSALGQKRTFAPQ
jgi:hypothetical protein